MRLRWKVLIILLSISIVPLFALSLTTRDKAHEMVNEMTSRSREILVNRARIDLLRRMKDHARLVGKERQVVALALRTQTGRLRQILDGSIKRIGRINHAGIKESDKHFVRQADGAYAALLIDRDRVRIELTPGATIDQAGAEEIFKPMLRPFRKLEKSNPDLIYWQIIRLTNGAVATYPYYEPLPSNTTHAAWMDDSPERTQVLPPMRRMPGRDFQDDVSGPPVMANIPPQLWYDAARESAQNIFWAPPFRDPVTGRFVMAAIAKIQEFRGPYYGAIMVMVPLGSVMQGDLDLAGLSRNTVSLMVTPLPEASGGMGLRVIAEEDQELAHSGHHGAWKSSQKKEWLSTSDPQALEAMANDLRDGRSGTATMLYRGKECLFVYAPIKLSRISLVLAVPMENIINAAMDAEKFVTAKIENQFMVISGIIWGMSALVLLISLILSKAMTRRISSLAEAFGELARGNFTSRVEVHGKDELSDLGTTFNELAPALEEQIRIKEALTIAQEVQRSLLPERSPQIPGLDVAGISLYCEDTGGDYYDYPHLGIETDEFGLAVGDVSGHGVPAALLMTTARALLRQRAKRGGSLGAVVSDANGMLAEDVRLSGRFMTLFLFAMDVDTRVARWVRAGHDPALIYEPATDSFSELGGDTGLPLGVDGDWEYVEEQTVLQDGSIILIGTDGIWEAANPDGERFGKERLQNTLRSNAAEDAQAILETILETLKEFTGDAGFEDDVTLAVVKIIPR